MGLARRRAAAFARRATHARRQQLRLDEPDRRHRGGRGYSGWREGWNLWLMLAQLLEELERHFRTGLSRT